MLLFLVVYRQNINHLPETKKGIKNGIIKGKHVSYHNFYHRRYTTLGSL